MHWREDSKETTAGCWPSPDSDRVLILTARPNQFTDRQYERLLAFLDVKEHQHLKRFRFETNRREYLLAHALTRWMLARCIGEQDPACVPIVRGEFGKPLIAYPGGPAFSLSHCAGTVACAVTYAGQIGVDVESSVQGLTVNEIGNLVYTPSELEYLGQEWSNKDAERTALRWWTVKESLLKADGRGFGVNPTAICCATPGRLNLAPVLLINRDMMHYQGAVVHSFEQYWIAWVVLGNIHRPRSHPSYGEWRGNEDWDQLSVDERWYFGC